MDREIIFTALFDLVKTTPGLITKSRRLKSWEDVPPPSQPALFLIQLPDRTEQREGLPAKWFLNAEILIYCSVGNDANRIPATIMNPILDALIVKLKPGNTANVQTLGGLVRHCWIGGQMHLDDGALDGQAVAIIPIEILVM